MVQLRARALTAFDSRDLTNVRRAFEGASACALRQAWRPEPEKRFAPGNVRVGWRDDEFLVFAELWDADIFSRATALNQRLWELGDAFEIFLKAVQREDYVEFQVSPNGG